MSKNYPIVATQYGDLTEAEVQAIQPGAALVLVREPDNKYDKNAVAIYLDGRRVGYVPKNQNGVLAQFIDQQGRDALVFGARPEAPPMGADANIQARKAIDGKFVRSPNSGFPMVEVP